MDLALALIDMSANACADLVKFLTFCADRLALASAPKAAYQERQIGAATSQHAMLKALELPQGWHAPLRAHTAARGIGFNSTAFDKGSLAFLTRLDLPLFNVR